jgi:hypothetical protein
MSVGCACVCLPLCVCVSTVHCSPVRACVCLCVVCVCVFTVHCFQAQGTVLDAGIPAQSTDVFAFVDRAGRTQLIFIGRHCAELCVCVCMYGGLCSWVAVVSVMRFGLT